MIAIILAAGEGTRLKPFTNDIPKALIQIAGKSLLEYNLDTIYPFVEEIIIVVKYKADTIKDKIGNRYKGVKVTYHVQTGEKGTGAAMQGIYRNADAVILYSDAIVSRVDVKKLMQYKGYAALGMKVKKPEKYGIFQVNAKGYLTKIIEKPTEKVGNLANFGFFKVNKNIFQIVEKLEKSPRGEYELTDAINEFIQKEKVKIITLKHPLYDITFPSDIEKVTKKIQQENKKYSIQMLSKKEFLKNFESFVETLENLKPSPEISKKRLKKFFEISVEQGPTFVAQKKNGEIIGSIKVLLEAKLIRGGQYAGKIEDFAVKNEYQGYGIGSRLMKQALAYCSKKGVYKVTLSCREELLGFYQKFGFEKYSTNMKLYFKK